MKNKKLTLLLAATLAANTLIACGEAADSGSETAAPSGDAETVTVEETTTADSGLDEVPPFAFEKDMHILLPGVSWLTPNIISEEATGERVNDAQYAMKLAMEERFGTTITEHYTGDIWGSSYISKLITAGDDSYDICYSLDLYAPAYILSDLIIPYTELEYVDLSRVYWDQNILKCMTINNMPYFAFGAYDLSYYDFTHCLAFNKEMIANFNLENPYDLVNSMSWTFDKFGELAQTVINDVNGDGVMKRKDDSWGYFAEPKEVLPSFWISAGELSIAKDENDLPYMNISGNTRFQAVFEKVYGVTWDNGAYCTDMLTTDVWGNARTMLADSRVLFVDEIFYRLNELRDVETDFGILPYPMYDAAQGQYYSRVEAGGRIGMVPISNKNPELAGALLEAMASYGYNNLIPEYYEVALKRKASRDSESEAMLDLIFATRRYDLGDTWWCNELRDGVFKDMFAKNNRNLASEIASSEQTVKDTLAQVAEKMGQA